MNGYGHGYGLGLAQKKKRRLPATALTLNGQTLALGGKVLKLGS